MSFHQLLTPFRIVVTTFIVLLQVAPQCLGFISARSQNSGAVVHWPQGSNLKFQSNELNSSGLSPDSIFNVLTTSLLRWRQVSYGGFAFTYYQGSKTHIYPTEPGASRENGIFFTSRSENGKVSCGVIALTELWFDDATGILSRSDPRFNDSCFTFSSLPNAARLAPPRIPLADVATHEIGHVLGLDHSQNLQSSLIFTESAEMAIPSCDDATAMMALYAPDEIRRKTGTLTGTIFTPGQQRQPVLGAVVNIIHLRRGTVLASAITDKNGHFLAPGLEPGHYGIMVEPFYPGPNALGPYYSGISSRICDGHSFERTFPQKQGLLKSFKISASSHVDIGAVTVQCQGPTSTHGMNESFALTAPLLSDGALKEPIAVLGVFTRTDQHFYRLAQQQDWIEAHALAFSLFSLADVSVEILDESGELIPQQKSADIFRYFPFLFQ